MGGARNQKRTAAYVNLCQTIYGGLHCVFFFFNDTATPEIYTLSLHDALPISSGGRRGRLGATRGSWTLHRREPELAVVVGRSEEHTSELQSHSDLVCRLLLEKKKKTRRLQPVCNNVRRHPE